MKIAKILPVIFLFTSCNYHSDNSLSCMENPDPNMKLLVIVGEKIDIKEGNPPFEMMDNMLGYNKFIAHYLILQKVCGEYDKDTITFTVYDHYGFPPFGKFYHALLFLNNSKDEIYHESYQYFPLYKTKDGRWASSYPVDEYLRIKEKESKIKPEKIEFEPEVSYSIEGLTRSSTQKRFPEPFYKIDKINKKAIAIWGNYVPELFQLKKEGVLRARGLFGTKDPIDSTPIEILDIERLNLSKQDSLHLLKAWNLLVFAIKAGDTAVIRKNSFDSIYCSVCEGMPRLYYENNLESIDMFIDSVNLNFQKSGTWSLLNRNKPKFSVEKYPANHSNAYGQKENERFIFYSLRFRTTTTIGDQSNLQYHTFEFVKRNDHFLFYSMISH